MIAHRLSVRPAVLYKRYVSLKAICVLRKMKTLSRETIHIKLFLFPSEKRTTLEGKTLLPEGVKSFLIRYSPVLKPSCVVICGMKQGSHKSYLPLRKWRNNVSSTLKIRSVE